MGNPTNPNRVVRVKDLNRFKDKLDEQGESITYATVATCESIIDELT
jgi:hypothetical protein